MSREKQLVKNTLIITIGKISTQFISFLLLPLYTALLTTEEYGIIDIVSTYINLIIPLITLQIEQAIFRFLVDVRDNPKEEKEIISTVFVFLAGILIVMLIVFLILNNFIDVNYKYLVCANMISTMFFIITLQVSRGKGVNQVYAATSLLNTSINIISNIVLIAILKMGMNGMFISVFIANIISIIYLFARLDLIKSISLKAYSSDKLKQMLKYSCPLVPNGISWWVVGVSDRTIISSVLSLSMNGIYSIANKFSNIYITVYNIFNISWTETASMHINDKDRDDFFSKVINISLKFFISMGLVIIVSLPLVINLLIAKEYTSAYNQIPILIIAGMFNIVSAMLGGIYVACKITSKISSTSIIAAIINIVINLVLIKRIGLYAASISTFVSYFVMAVMRWVDLKKYVGLKIDKKMILFFAGMLIFNVSLYYINNATLNIINFILTLTVVAIVNKQIIRKIIDKAISICNIKLKIKEL